MMKMRIEDLTPGGLILKIAGVDYEIFLDENYKIQICDVEGRELDPKEIEVVWKAIRLNIRDYF